MTLEEAATLRCQGPEPLRRRLYRALARALEASRSTAVVAFLTTLETPEPWVVVRPRALVDVVRSEPVLEAAWSPARAPSILPPASWFGRLATGVPHRGSFVRTDADPIDVPLAGPLVGPTGWLAIQTFWVGGNGGGPWVARRWWFAAPSRRQSADRLEAVSTAVAHTWGLATGRPARPTRLRPGARRDWVRLGTGSFPRLAWIPIAPDRIDGTPEPRWAPNARFVPARAGHAVVLGASGAGKTWFLADRAAHAIARGEPVVALDLHGDLTPSIVARLDPGARSRAVCLDLSDRPVPGIAAIAPGASPERAAAHLVAALKRLTPDGSEVYWGFRLERIFDSFVRLVQESGGSLLDLHALLTDPDLRDAARLATREPDLARFLEELGPIVRRTPDFLWAATARLAKVAAIPSLAELLAPGDGGLPVEELLGAGRPLLVRIPLALLGPEAAAFAGTLVLARIYLGVAAGRSEGVRRPPATVVLDEVQCLSPRLVAEMLADGRKFGFRLLVATQFPERLAPDLRSAVAGVVRDFVAFRIPRPSVAVAGEWLGLTPADSERWLTDLPAGHGLARNPDVPAIQPIGPVPGSALPEEETWAQAVRATREEFGPSASSDLGPVPDDPASERLLLAILAAEEQSRPLGVAELVGAAGRLPGPAIDGALLSDRILPLERRGYFRRAGDGVRLTPAGERRLGLGAPSGATRESDEHRALVLRAFRLFARRGHLLEVVRQGRYDTRLPDAFYRQIPERVRVGPPGELAETLDRVREGWAWRFFRGRDVHVEAEVSGALRPARIRHGLAKAQARRAFALFLVTDGRRAARVRATLRGLGIGIDRAQVWTLAPPGAGGPSGSPRDPDRFARETAHRTAVAAPPVDAS
ncbi:MAG: hypothetical protein ACLQD8_06235 [Thermoplasmata archaeon]